MSTEKIPAAINAPETSYETLTAQRSHGIYVHPTDSTKLVRWSEYTDNEKDIIHPFKNYLDNLEHAYRIPTVHPNFALSANSLPLLARSIGMRSSIDIISVVDKVEGGVTLDELIEADSLDDEKVQEYDLLAQRLIAQLDDVYEYGGVFCKEFYYYHQYLYSDAAATGQKLILTDVDPLGFYALPELASRLQGGIPVSLLCTLVNFSIDLINLECQASTQLAATSELISLVEKIESQGVAIVEEAKLRTLQALEDSDVGYLRVKDEFNEDESESMYALLSEDPTLHLLDQCMHVSKYLETNKDIC